MAYQTVYGWGMPPETPAMPSPAPTPIPAPAPSSPMPIDQSPKKPKKILWISVVLMLIVGASAASYYIGTQKKTPEPQPDVRVETVVPQDATVSAECVSGRGKQYILPKDIPMGPIYDVSNGKVVAIEYLIDFSELKSMPEKYTNLGVETSQHDHVAIIAVSPHAGLNKEHFHLVNYFITPEQAAAITCDNKTTDTTMHMH
jgi:hypothetical protein